MIPLLKKHWVILPVACAVAVFMLLPQMLFVRELGGDYRGIPRFVDDDAWYYLTRAREVIDGHPAMGNPYFAEHKSKPSVLFYLPDLFAAPIGWLGIEVPNGYLFWISFFNALNAVLVYAAVFLLTRSRLAGVLAAIFLFLGMFARTFNRPTANSATTPFWILEFILLLKFLRASRRSWKIFIANVAGLGILFYVYPYFWAFYLSLFSVFAVLWYFWPKLSTGLIKQGLMERIRLRLTSGGGGGLTSAYGPKHLLGIAGCALIVAIPYFLNLQEASQLPEFGETYRRDGGLLSHFPAGIRIVLPAGLLLAILWLLFRFRVLSVTIEGLLVASGLIALIGATNQHILTGKHIEPSLHYWDIGVLWSTFAASYIVVYAARFIQGKWRKIFVAALIGIVLVFSGYSIFTHTRVYGTIAEYDRANQRYRSALDWLARQSFASQNLGGLAKNVERDEVVFANETLSAFIPAYTPANVLFDRNANHYFVSDREVRERFLLNHYFDAVDEAYLRARERSLWGVQYIDAAGHARQQNKLRKFLGLAQKPAPTLPARELEKALLAFWELLRGDFEAELRRYHVEWVTWDMVRDPHWAGVASLPFLEKVFEVDGVAIFRLH